MIAAHRCAGGGQGAGAAVAQLVEAWRGVQVLSAAQGAPCEGPVGLGRGVPGAGMPRTPAASSPSRGVSRPSALTHTPAHHLLTPLWGDRLTPPLASGVWPREWDPPFPSLLEPLKLHLRHQPAKGLRSGTPLPGPATGVTGSCKQTDRRGREHCPRGDASLPGLLSELLSEPGTSRGSRVPRTVSVRTMPTIAVWP